MRKLSLLFSIALCACTGARPSTSVAPVAPVAGAFDIVISNGKVVRAGDQFGVGMKP